MKSGRLILLLIPVSIIAAHTFLKKNVKYTAVPDARQYKNRLNEFCINDVDQAKNEFEEFLGMGFNPSDAFDMTIIKRVFI